MNKTKMAKLKTVLSFFLIIGMVSSDFMHKSDKEFRFTKTKDESNEFDFEYDLSDGEIFRGKTFVLADWVNIYVMIGKDQIYYAEFTDDELNSEKTFSKADARIAQGTDEGVEVMDNIRVYRIGILGGEFRFFHYDAAWDVENICFTAAKTANQTFDFEIRSKNNCRKYNGKTYRETDDPHVQRVDINDVTSQAIYEINFTEKELQANDTFCRGHTKLISASADAGPAVGLLNPKLQEALALIPQSLLKSLVG